MLLIVAVCVHRHRFHGRLSRRKVAWSTGVRPSTARQSRPRPSQSGLTVVLESAPPQFSLATTVRPPEHAGRAVGLPENVSGRACQWCSELIVNRELNTCCRHGILHVDIRPACITFYSDACWCMWNVPIERCVRLPITIFFGVANCQQPLFICTGQSAVVF